ncbi:protein KASH5-like isoform X3 [Hirundo rustica]|uniref:protein KASH5-like isoform X3 n=1 Tax=Hirundo rustica TaxID=43150 RepID=UPI001A94368A|nr:protein KASH5-like isoform X3 [Hirundo rustica]
MATEGPCGPGAVIPLPAPAESGCSDEFALDCTFAACDPEQTGMVQPQRVVEYVAAMTGHSGHDGQLQALRRALDPAAAGTALDWSRFRTAMGAWIAACRQDGAEEQDMVTGDTGPGPAEDNGRASPAAAQLQGDNTDITTPAEAAGLRSRARQLAAQNAKLQRDAELAEELNARLAEEIAQLQAQMRSSRQALEQARVSIEELDDTKAVVKRLEEENTELRRQARHVEKEQRNLCSQAEGLQEERLLTEGQGLREQIQAQAVRMASLEAQLCRGTALLSARDAALAQAGQRAQELTAALEEYERVVQELRLETTRLRQQLGQMRDAWAMRPWCPRSQLDIQAAATASQGTGDKEEDTGTALSGGGGLAGNSEEATEAVVPQVPLSPCAKLSPLTPWTPLPPWALALLALLALLYLLPRQWPQPQLRYGSPPPL